MRIKSIIKYVLNSLPANSLDVTVHDFNKSRDQKSYTQELFKSDCENE